jgi:hypothetical protein
MAPGAESLAELARQVRGETLRLLAAAPDDWLTWAPEGTSNHILWHAGHAVWVQDGLFVELVTGHSELPAGWNETFGMDGRPVKATNAIQAWPSRVEVAHLLSRQLTRVLELLETLPADALTAPVLPDVGQRNLLSAAVHGWHDEAKHQGEMYLLLKLRRAMASPR